MQWAMPFIAAAAHVVPLPLFTNNGAATDRLGVEAGGRNSVGTFSS